MLKRVLFLIFCVLILSSIDTYYVAYASSPQEFNASTDWSGSTIGTPLDVSSLVLDAPAGKHGFVQVKDGHFYFQDGIRVKFWGANLGLSGNFPSHQDADHLVEKLAALGFNAVRLHNLDNDNNASSTLIDRTLNHTKKFNPDNVDKLDYLIYLLKKKGIYVLIDVQTSHRFKSGDGVTDYDKLPNRAAKTVDYFDESIIQIEKDFASALFGHVNSYTGLAYKDDPVLALLGMTNEDYLFSAWIDGSLNGVSAPAKSLPPYYLNKLDAKFNQFLKNKYDSQEALAQAWNAPVSEENLLTNGDFEASYSGDWIVSANDGLKTTVIQSSENPHGGEYNIKFQQTKTTSHASASDLVMKQLGVKLQKGHTYQLSFYGVRYTEGKSTLKVQFGNDGYLEQKYGLDTNFTLDSAEGWKEYTATFVATEDTSNDPQASIMFNCGWCWGDVAFDDIRLTENQLPSFVNGESLEQSNIERTSWADRFKYSPKRISDVSEFYYSILTSYFNDMMDHLKNTVGIQVPISTSNNYTTNSEIMARTAGDYMDGHVYWDHPKFPSVEWSVTDFTQTNESLIAKAGNMANKRYFSNWIELLALNRVENKPFIVGEWQDTFPNDYEFEGAPILASYAQLQDWDGLFIFDYSGTSNYSRDASQMKYWFDILGNPAKLAQMPIYSLSFLKGYVLPAAHTIKVQYNNQEVISNTIVNGNTPNYNIKNNLPTAILYAHKVVKSFNANSTSAAFDLISEEEDKKLSAETRHTSDTGEIVWDVSSKGAETFAINTPKSQSITGFITDQTLSTTDLTTSLTAPTYPFGSVALQPLDDKRIVDSSNMLLTLISKQHNTGQTKKTNNGLLDWGKAPTLMQPLTGKVQIHMNLDGIDTVQVYQLDMNGKQIGKLPVSLDTINNKVTITINSLSSPYIQVVKY